MATRADDILPHNSFGGRCFQPSAWQKSCSCPKLCGQNRPFPSSNPLKKTKKRAWRKQRALSSDTRLHYMTLFCTISFENMLLFMVHLRKPIFYSTICPSRQGTSSNLPASLTHIRARCKPADSLTSAIKEVDLLPQSACVSASDRDKKKRPKSRESKRDKLKGTNGAKIRSFFVVEFRWFLHIFPLSWELAAFRKRRFSRETAKFCRHTPLIFAETGFVPFS